MLYLEDYLEMIEHLPIELRDRFTEMREIDLGVENTVDRSVIIYSSAGLNDLIHSFYSIFLKFARKTEGFLLSSCQHESY